MAENRQGVLKNKKLDPLMGSPVRESLSKAARVGENVGMKEDGACFKSSLTT